MNEIVEARVKLELLEKQEQKLVEQVYSVRAAVRAQRSKLEQLVKRIPPPINRLPNETLLLIFKLSGHSSVLGLTAVSRCWRNAMLQCPTLWKTIKVTPSWSKHLVETHVTRSSQCPLDIEIHGWEDGESHEGLLAMLGVLVSCSHRWYSLVIQADVSNSHLNKSLKRINHRKTYPSLTHVSIKKIPLLLYGTAKLCHFYAGSCPRLEHLELGAEFEDSSGFQVPPSLTSLAFGLGDSGPSSILQRLSLQKLTTLSLSGSASGVQIAPHSIYLPLLEKFVCEASGANVLIQAIMAPKLVHFEYNPPGWNYMLDNNCRTPAHHGVINLNLSGTAFRCGNETVDFVFPAVRHIDLGDPEVAFLVFSSGNGSISRAPDHWPHLESLTVRGLSEGFLQFLDGLVEWLKARQAVGLPRLLVRFEFWARHYEDGSTTSMLFEALHELSILEWINVRLGPGIMFSGAMDKLLQLVCTFHLIAMVKVDSALV